VAAPVDRDCRRKNLPEQGVEQHQISAHLRRFEVVLHLASQTATVIAFYVVREA
jgi:hypothetical protein